SSFRRDAETNTRDACATRRKPRASSPRSPESEPKTPGKQRSGVGPDPGFGVAQNNNNDVAPRARAARNQTVAGCFGVAGFHAVAKGKPFQNLVRVFQFAGPTVGVAKN